MQRFVILALFLSAGCHFHTALPNSSASPTPDLAFGGTDDLGSDVGAASDLATAGDPDLAAAPDLLPDPCGTPTALGTGNVPAQCVIGAPPTIDGNLADWPPLAQFATLTEANAAVAGGSWQQDPAQDDPDLSAKYFVRWDAQNLYVAVAVTDDIRNTPNSPPYLTDNDAVEVFLDGNHDRKAYSTDDWQLVLSEDGKTAAGQPTVVAFPSGAKAVAVEGAGANYTVEFAVPWSVMKVTSPTASALIGFDLKIDDNDGGSTRARDLVLFETMAGTAPIDSPSTFGTVQLMGR